MYELPRRPLGGLCLVAVIMVLFGAGFAAGPLVSGLAGVARSSSPGGFDWVFLAASLPFVAAGLLISAIGLAVLFGHTEIELRRDGIAAVERFGPLSWRRRRRARLRRITVSRGVARANGRVVSQGRLAEMAAMTAGFEDERDLILAVGYPEPWLLDLAGRLSRDHEIERPADLLHEGRVDVVRHDPAGAEEDDDAPAPRPPRSTVQLHENADGMTLVIPPAGLLKGSKGLFAFGVLWCAFTAAMTGAMIASPQKAADVWLLLLFGVVFWAVGIGLLTAGVNMGRRHAIIDVVDDVLLVNRSNIFGLRSHQWAASQIERIWVGPSGMEVNEQPVLELKVQPVTGKAVGLFAGRDDRELRWMAGVLRKAIKGQLTATLFSSPSSRSPSGSR